MRTRNSHFPNNSPVTIPRRRNRRRAPNVVEPELRTIVEVAPMAERTMEELLQAPTEGYGEAIVIPEINADHFEIKTNLLQLVQANPFHGFERENPHTHINNFKRITSTLKFRDVPNDVIKLMMFPYSLEGAARVCEAWERFKEMLRACPHHGFTELTQIDTFYNGLNENDQDSLNAAAGGNLLSKTTREALNIIENKSKVRYSRNKSNVSRMNTTSRESSSKTDERIDKLADQISTLIKIVSKKVVTPAPVKAVEKICVTCNGPHAWYNCPNTDNSQSSVCAAMGTYNQVNPLNRVSNQMAPPGFAPVQNNGQNRYNQNQGQGNNFNRGNNFHGNQGFQAQINHAPNFQNQGFQNQPFQVHNNQVQQEFSNEFSSYKRTNDQMMRNMQNQINSLKGEFKNEIQNTMKTQQTVLMNQQNAFQNNLQNMLSGFFQNQASTSGTLPSNTIPNPKGEMKAITTRSGVAYEGPSIPTNPSPKKVVERETEETTDKEQTNFQGSTAHIQPPVNPIPIPKPDVPKTLPKPNIPYPSRRNDQKFREKASNQMEKIFQIFQDLRFDISFADALLLMPRFAPTIKNLLMNKEKLLELAKIPLNENCSAMLLKKLPEKLGDPGKFLIPCDFPGMDLADLSITGPKGLAEDVFVKVRKFHFPTDFVVVDFEADPRVPLILRRSFLRTGRALIDVYREEITLRVNDEAVTFNLDQTTRYSSTYDDMSINRIDVIDVACEEYSQEVLGFSNKSSGGNPTMTFEPIISDSFLSFTPFEKNDFILEEIEDFLKDDLISPEIDHANYDPKGDICLIEKLLNNNPFQLPLMDLKEVTKAKPSIANMCMMAIFHDMIEKTMEVFMDDFLVFGDIFATCLSNLDKMLKRCEDMNLVLNWEKCHFMCKEGIVLGHKISKSGIEVDRAKVDVIAKLPHPTTVKGVRSFLETPFVFSKHCIDAFETLKKKLNEAPILVVPDWNLPFKLMCDASDFAIGAGSLNLAADHLSRLENPHKDVLENKDIIDVIDEINYADLDLEGDLHLIKELLNNDPSSPLPLSHNPLSSSTTFSSPGLTPIVTSDALLKKFTDEHALHKPFPPGIGDDDFDPEGDILLLEKLLNDDPSSPLPPKELNFEKLKMIKSSIDDFSSIKVYEEKSMTFSNPLFDSNDNFTFSNDETLSDEDVPEDNVKIYSNPLFKYDDEYISSDVNPFFDEVLEDIESKDSYVSNLNELTLLVTPLSDANEDECFDPGGVINEIDAFLDMDISTDIENGYHDSKGDIIYLESLLIDDTIPNLPPEVFLDHDPRSLKDEPDNDDLMTEDKVFNLEIWEIIFSPTYVKLTFEDRHYLSLTYVIRIFLPYFTYSVNSFLLSSGSEDTIFDPGIPVFSLEPVVSHRSGTFMFVCSSTGVVSLHRTAFVSRPERVIQMLEANADPSSLNMGGGEINGNDDTGYGLIRQPKYEHLKELHKAIKQCEPALVSADPTVTSIGNLQQAHIFSSKSGYCATFLANYNTNNTTKVMSGFNQLKCKMLPTNTELFTWETYNEDLTMVDESSTFTVSGLLEQVNVTRDDTYYLWYTTKLCAWSCEHCAAMFWYGERLKGYSKVQTLDTTYLTFCSGQRIEFYSLNNGSVLPSNTAYSVNSIRRTGIQQTYTETVDKETSMAEPNDYITATQKNFVTNDNEGRMVEKCIVEIQGAFLVKICDYAFSGNIGEMRSNTLINFLKLLGQSKLMG
ncbi:reverse transcriptase domain-containing protein [Tanacetum coccineum]|uniref:Reverse transcriptase domain-containing protein n=1 Tax=Tanacetum coccineum TaxID=301880 RepID=A0ABQ5AX40_9ASTR